MGLKFRGRPPVRIAESVQDVVRLRHPLARAIIDRSEPLTDDIVDAVLGQSLFTWQGRNPSPALDADGNFTSTDLDLLSFLVPMAEYGAVIEIPKYKNKRVVVRREGERKIGKNQFGPIRGLISHKDVFSFSARINDKTIVRRHPRTGLELIGDWRNYMIVDCDGHWYNGWNRIHWNPIVEENNFLTEKGLWTGNTVYFRNYVHPNRWQSVFGAPNLLAHMLIERIDDEATFYKVEIGRLRSIGIALAPSTVMQRGKVVSEGPKESIKVKTMQMKLVTDGLKNSYAQLPDTKESLRYAHKRYKQLIWTIKPRAQFIKRANEAAYFKYGHGKIAHWMEGRSWNEHKVKRTTWNQMVLSNDCALRYRVLEVTQQISAE